MRMARAALDWSVRTVAERAQVQRMAVMQLERGRAGDPLTVRAIATAFEAAGIEFIGDDAPGVRLRSSAALAARSQATRSSLELPVTGLGLASCW